MAIKLGTACIFVKKWLFCLRMEFLNAQAKNNYVKGHNVAKSKNPIGFPHITINMIFGGAEVNGVTFVATRKTKILVTHGKRVREIFDDDEISFSEEDVDDHILPHNNALVISLHVLDFKIKYVLIDLGN